MLTSASRERRWLVLVEDGRHVWQGRERDPDPDDVAQLESTMFAQELRGWLAVSEGKYYSSGEFRLMQVRALNTPVCDWSDAELQFHQLRASACEER